MDPEVPTGPVELQPPPPLEPREGAGGVLLTAVPVLGSLGAVAVMAATSGGSGPGLGPAHLAAGLLVLTTVGFVGVQLERQRSRRAQRVAAARTRYLRHLADVRRRVRVAAEQQRHALGWRHPPPAALPALAAAGSRVWERREGDAEFLHVRHGTATGRLSTPLVLPEEAADPPDPVCAAAVHRLVEAHADQPDLPTTLDLAAVDALAVGEDRARAIICSAATFHDPRHLLVAVVAAPDRLPAWDWVKWLPHARSPHAHDALGARRLLVPDPAELAGLVPDGPHLLLVADRAAPPNPGRPGTTVLHVGHGGPVGCPRLDATGGDRCDPVTAEALARRLAPSRHDLRARRSGAATDVLDLLGLGDVDALVPEVAWGTRTERERLRVPIGVDPDGVPVHLDLKESAEHGMGPHGLLVGATGSGKSELLRTLVLGLAATHPPEQLAMVLVDFKGGATFAGLGRLPHVSATITNLEQDLTLVDRMADALSGELVRRQELLRAAGNLASLREHVRARANGADLDPLPSLLVVVDEFSELLAAQPEFADLFAAVGRLGRSLGIHLLLASQRLDEGRLRGLEAHLSYRIGLRTFSAAESHAVLGVPDAHALPPQPGVGYLRSGPATLRRFEAAYASGPGPARPAAPTPAGVLPFTAATVPGAPTVAPDADRASLLDVAVARLAGHGVRARRIWQPPLEEPDTLDALMPDLVVAPRLGLVSHAWRDRPGLVVPIGAVDRPREQRRDPLVLDLAGAGGHVAVVGGPRSGTTTLLRTLVASLALTTTPAESVFYLLDLTGGGLAGLAGLPHVAGVTGRTRPDVVRRVVAQVRDHLERREAGEEGVDGRVFLVVDGWSTLRSDFDDLEAEVQQVAAHGLGHGVHLLAGATRWSDFRPGLRDLLGSRVELRLGDPLDSEVDRRVAARVPHGRPGRGLAVGGEHVLGALPRIDGDPSTSTLDTGIEDLVSRVAAAWDGPVAPPLRLLPARIELAVVRARATGTDRLLLGVDERDHAPVGLDPGTEPHLLVLGEGGAGRSAVLRTYLHEVVRTRTPGEAQVIVVDPRRSLLGEVPESHLLDHLASAAAAGTALRDLAAYLGQRLPGPDVTPAQLRARAWWAGAEVFVVVDDHDLLTGAGSPVAALLPLLPQAGDVGLHLVVARRTGGAARALHEPVLQSLRELAAPGLMLSGDPAEGPLLGPVRPTRLPPGRGHLVTRDTVRTLQIAWSDPAASEA